jgi:hypothetical protein
LIWSPQSASATHCVTLSCREIEKAQDVMEDITDALQLSDELGEALSTQIGPAMDEVGSTELAWIFY